LKYYTFRLFIFIYIRWW